MSTPGPSNTEYVVIRPAGQIADSDMPSVAEGEWRKRADLVDQNSIELLGPEGNVHALPTDRTEQAADGSIAQVYEVPENAGEDDAQQDGPAAGDEDADRDR